MTRFNQPINRPTSTPTRWLLNATLAIAWCLICAAAPAQAEVSVLAGLLTDKFVSHLPLYRQHQRMEAAGIHLARSTLTNLVRRSIDLLAPICEAQWQHILASKVLAMD